MKPGEKNKNCEKNYVKIEPDHFNNQYHTISFEITLANQ
jgi:hypothetical protein